MPTLKNKTPNNLPKMTGDTGYGLGFFCGCLVGAIGTYIAFTKEGKDLKDRIIKEYRVNQQNLTPTQSTSLNSIKQVIQKIRQALPQEAKSLTAAVINTVQSHESKKKHYFKKK